MDKQMIETITKEVIKRMGTTPDRNRGRRPAAGVKTGGQVLALFTGGDHNLATAFAQVKAIKDSGSEVTLVLSPAAIQIIGREKICSATGVRKVITNWRDAGKLPPLMQGVTGVVVPVLTLNTLSKVSFLQGDSLIANIIIQALLRGIPVVAATDSIICPDVASIPNGVKSRLDRINQNVAAMGMALVSCDRLAATIANPPATPTIPACPSSATAPAAVASSPSAAGIVVGDKVVSVCTGDPADCVGCGLCVTNLPQRVDSVINAGATRIGAGVGVGNVPQNVAQYIDHTMLKAAVTRDDILQLCAEAREYSFASVCVNTHWVKLCAEQLAGASAKVCTVVGFPLGAMATAAKAAETLNAVQDGAEEIDMVMNIGALKAGDLDTVRNDIAAVVQAAGGRIVKVILETALLTDKEKVTACILCKEAGAHFVKTSTGFGPGGATIADIALMRQTVGPDMGVKASGGIRDLETTQDMLRAGATRIGASASIAIAEGRVDSGSGY